MSRTSALLLSLNAGFARATEALVSASVFVVVSASLLGCQRSKEPPITLQVGPDQVIRFQPISGFARYWELPGQEDQLRVVLASYPLACDEYRAPEQGEVLVTLNVKAPPEKLPLDEAIPWNGIPLEEEESELPQAEGDEKKEKSEEEPSSSVLPFVRLAKDARALPPGGHLKLSLFEREVHGRVEGEMAFRDAGEGEAPTTAMMGRFSVRFCSVNLDPLRATEDPEEEEKGK